MRTYKIIDALGMLHGTVKAQDQTTAIAKYSEGFSDPNKEYLRNVLIAIDVENIEVFKNQIQKLK